VSRFNAAERKEAKPDQYRTVARVVAALALLAETTEPIRLTDFARRVNMPISSAHVLLQALSGLGYAAIGPGERGYVRGPELVRLGVRIVSEFKIAEVARPWLAQLAARTGEDVYLALPGASGIAYTDRVEGSHSLRLNVRLGIDRPLHATSVGKLYLAFLDESRPQSLLSQLRLERFTEHTITNLDSLRAQLAEIRRAGYSLSDQEHLDGIVAVAAPVLGADGLLVGALSLSIPQGRFWPRKDELLRDLQKAAANVAVAVGGRIDARSSAASYGETASVKSRGARERELGSRSRPAAAAAPQRRSE
jgi:IclR family KDG regulon transcriptional repressor